MICVKLNKRSGAETLNPAIHASICWTFRSRSSQTRTHDPPFSNQIDAAV